MQPGKLKTFLIWGALIGVFIVLLQQTDDPEAQPATTATLKSLLNSDDVESYGFERTTVEFTQASTGVRYSVPIDWQGSEWQDELAPEFENSSAFFEYEPRSQSGPSNLLYYLFIGAVALLVFVFIVRRFGGGAQQNIFALRTSKARLAEDSSKVKFDDIGGCEEAKRELSDIVSFLKSPQKWADAGARLPRGVLLEGPPGCGKTLLARAVAGETDARFYFTSASEFVEMFIGVGPARVRDMFETARKESPSVLFIDELDAIGRRRGSGVGFANEEREQTLNQILVAMDGFEPTDSVVVIAATNRADILDKALVRAGRFDRRITIDSLNEEQRAVVLGIHTRAKPIAESVSLKEIAAQTDGFTGADLETLTNLAALLSVRRTSENGDKPGISAEDFALAIQKRMEQQQSYDALDAVLFEATTQLAEPSVRAVVRVTLLNDTTVEGDVLWIDPNFVKIRRDDDSTCIVPKTQIAQMESLKGTATVSGDDLHVDRSLGNGPNFA